MIKVGGMTSRVVVIRAVEVAVLYRMIVSSLVVVEEVVFKVVEGLVGSIRAESALAALKVEEEVGVGASHQQTDTPVTLIQGTRTVVRPDSSTSLLAGALTPTFEVRISLHTKLI